VVRGLWGFGGAAGAAGNGNPLLADAAGIVALDARLRVAPAQYRGAARLAIAPYPQYLESIERLRDGTALRIRPLRPEDEPMMHDLAGHMSHEDLRLRFFTPARGLTHTVAARLSQLDYDREMALLAEYDGIALGVAHFFADPDNLRAEYAIAVRSDLERARPRIFADGLEAARESAPA
jgi:acetyltransferase